MSNAQMAKVLLGLSIQSITVKNYDLAEFLLDCSDALYRADETIAKLRTGLS
jgi:hypothetical protein